MVENTVGKGEIACDERLVLQTRKNQGLFGKGLTKGQNPKCLQINPLPHNPMF